MYTKQIIWFSRPCTLACDGNCAKAFGINGRPKIDFDPADPDDYAWLADGEVEDAPANPGTYEGGWGKPQGPHEMNKWCARECERSEIFVEGETVKLREFVVRRYNQLRKHPEQK